VIFTAGIGVMLLLGASAAVRGKLFTDRDDGSRGEDPR